MTREELALQVLRLESSWGSPNNRTPEQFSIMCEEWFRALGRYGSKTVTAAVSHAIDHHKFGWTGSGPLPEIVSFCTRDDREWRDAIGMVNHSPHLQIQDMREVPEKFERDGRTREEEIEFRTRQVEEMKRRAGFKSAADIEAEEIAARPRKEIPPAMEASEALKSTKLVRNLLAKQRRASDGPANQTTSPPTASGLFDDTEHGPN